MHLKFLMKIHKGLNNCTISRNSHWSNATLFTPVSSLETTVEFKYLRGMPNRKENVFLRFFVSTHDDIKLFNKLGMLGFIATLYEMASFEFEAYKIQNVTIKFLIFVSYSINELRFYYCSLSK